MCASFDWRTLVTRTGLSVICIGDQKAMVETREVLERILARLPPRALRDSCNGVLLSELDTVRSCLDNVSEAFKKLKEVGEAVTMLQLDKSDRRRSDRLMALVDSTEETQRDTMLALRRMRSVFAESQAVGSVAWRVLRGLSVSNPVLSTCRLGVYCKSLTTLPRILEPMIRQNADH